MFLDVWWVPPSTAAVHFLIRVPVVQWELPLSHGGGGLIDKQEMENPKRLQKVWKQVGYLVIYIYIHIFIIEYREFASFGQFQVHWWLQILCRWMGLNESKAQKLHGTQTDLWFKLLRKYNLRRIGWLQLIWFCQPVTLCGWDVLLHLW